MFRTISTLLASLLLSLHPTAQPFVHHSIIIDEIYPDPTPSFGLPAYEYLELRNNSGFTVDLKSWKISDGNTTAVISITLLLEPDSIVVLCATAAASLFTGYGRCIGLASFLSLNNESDLVYLISPEGKVIHAVHYDLSWYGNAVAALGGRSLEMKDTRYPCSGKDNWAASTAPSGGTPGAVNAVQGEQADKKAPLYARGYAEDPYHILLLWDETIDSAFAQEPTHYVLKDLPLKRAVPMRPLFDQVRLELAVPLQQGMEHELTVLVMRDCAGNATARPDTVLIRLFDRPQPNAIVFNELLFDPPPDGSDYIELYNRSRNCIDLQELFVGNRSPAGQAVNTRRISELPFALMPGQYLVLSEHPELLSVQRYGMPPHTPYMRFNDMPSLPDDRGDLILLDRNGITIDALQYEKDWHYPLLQTTEGVSLERVNPDGPSQDPGNWGSAASVAGYGTPGKKNSQYMILSNGYAGIRADPPVFSPDNDGVDDRTGLHYELEAPGVMVRIRVYDANGHLVATPWPQATLAQKGVLWWDGTNERRQVLASGNYILHMELIRTNGKVQQVKRVVTIAKGR